MNLAMTVEASTLHELTRRQNTARQIGAAEGLAIVLRAVVAILAQIGYALLQQRLLNAAMGRMANGALFLNGRVLP